MSKNKIIEVYAHWHTLGQPTFIGFLTAELTRGKEIFSFEYDENWLKHPEAAELDPAMNLYSGKFYAPQDKSNFGVFLDSSPDRWGRILMDRREAQQARKEDRKERRLLESDYLLGVYDLHRMGALRFKLEGNESFLDDKKTLTSPPWTSLRELEHASLEIEKENSENKADYLKWLEMLIAPGGSLGGARPKASVVDENQHLWIAKFPSGNDEINVGAWEMVVHKLAKEAQINVSEAVIEKFNSPHHTFLNKRFDRTESGERIHFASAMTLLGYADGADASEGVSYLELAQFIIAKGANPTADLEQLWRRIVFYICVSNTDDHLRNHGFLLHPNGWVLSPAFDINPVRNGNGLKLNITETNNELNLDLARTVAKYFRIDKIKADEIIALTLKVTNKWRKVASGLKISSKEQDKMANAFKI